MTHWIKLAAPLMAATVPSNGYATEYLSITQSQRISFPAADEFIPIGPRAWRVASDGKPQGRYVVDRVIGKHLYIDYAVTLDARGHVQRVDILQYREAYGGEVRERGWLNQFVGKGPGNAIQVGVDIRNISGATLSSHHIAEGVKRIVTRYGKGTQ